MCYCLTHLVVNILTLFLFYDIYDSMYFSCACLLNMGCTLFVWDGLRSWHAYLFGHVVTYIIYLSAELGGWNQFADCVVNGVAYFFNGSVIYGVAFLYWLWAMYMCVRFCVSMMSISMMSPAITSISMVSMTSIMSFGISFSFSIGLTPPARTSDGTKERSC